ncbi:N-acetylglucosamine-6-phosphate deacetylase [Phaeobacter sp. C3_T13_0]|uniref:N-acetylglucosamine-6-phosphate deacetylase n=1 Tax=Phaeobacter cretensis TaxID=3342641 RepID=UPI0039BCD1B6
MTGDPHQISALTGARILTPVGWEDDSALMIRGDQIVAVLPNGKIPDGADVTVLDGGVLSAGFVDLQVNGGGGVMFNDAPELEQLQVIAAAHARIGATSILPTLITDAPNFVIRAIDAVIEAVALGVPGIIGLHLEGPHLAVSRKGAHDASLIRPMSDVDLEVLCTAATRLPVLKVTLACEAVTPLQIRCLSDAGVLVSLGHTDASHADCMAAVAAGARCVTHLFNAQSQLGNREPGVVGAALDLGGLSAGLIADGVHVHPATMRAALEAKTGPGQVFLVSDSMATGGSEIDRFTLNGRGIRRDGNRLTLADGTLAGAHLELATAVGVLVEHCGVPLDTALDMASTRPADLLGRSDLGRLQPGARADVLHLSDGLELQRVWQGGQAV